MISRSIDPPQDLPYQEKKAARVEVGILLTSIFIIAVCGLLYELIIATLSSYLLGDSIYRFSLTIGIFLTAMGVGSFLSRLVRNDLLGIFIIVELAIGLFGGFSSLGLFAAYTFLPRSYTLIMIIIIATLGALIGLEIPLLTRLAGRYGTLRHTISNVLAFDYLGALFASLVFPLVLLPYLGLSKTSLLVGFFNLLVVGLNLQVFAGQIPHRRFFIFALLGAILIIAGGFVRAEMINSLFEQRQYQDQIIYTTQSPYQHIVLTSYQNDLRLYLNNELQFSSRDEYRYHEGLVHPAMSLARSHENILIIGGGDGLAMREVLKYPDVQQATLLDLDPAMTDLGRRFPLLTSLNGDSLNQAKVQVLNADGYNYLADHNDLYQVIIIDLPDPHTEGVARLYSRDFYTILKRHLAGGGVIVTQASSPYFVRQAYWCIAHTMTAAGFSVQPYHVYVPAFGDWGFVLGTLDPLASTKKMVIPSAVSTRSFTADQFDRMKLFDPDMAETSTDLSTLENPVILRYYFAGWRYWRG